MSEESEKKLINQNRTKKKHPLVDEITLLQIIKHLDLEESRKSWMAERWLHYVIRWDRRATKNKQFERILRSVIIIGGALIPALVSLHTFANSSASLVEPVTIIVSLLIAISAGMESLFHPGEIWREKRAAEELLQAEGWRFIALTEPYLEKKHKEVFDQFAGAVEDIIVHEIKDYMVAASPNSQNQTEKAKTESNRSTNVIT